ncbi:Transcriptional regulator, RpiR family [Alkalibacterium sp. AK22]|uniref:MurR/RpiR family transcriptional regulator n=1 Tax=Alkalibacterium sp. AK22 TaxID=1229520 RepID=UPI00045288E7|nr:MurR/RpiR family transcriptional regulator [Alkalibacterium sp. AK22]EXJ23065.1 Transcriptional regulator, RpiR family [Alkalibacterium sp. AK22]
MLYELVNRYAEHLSENDYHIIDYIDSHAEAVKDMTIMELSGHCNISKSSILRLTKKLGFSGFSEFKFYLRDAQTDKAQQAAGSAFQSSETDIKRTIQLFESQAKEKIYERIDQAQTIYAYGTGWGQQNALQELNRYLVSMGKQVYLIPSLKELQVSCRHMCSADLVIFASLSGDLADITSDLKKISHAGIPTLSITSFKNNNLAELSTYQLYFQSTDFGFAFGVEHKSFIGLHVLIDHLVRGFFEYKLAQQGNRS